MKSRLGFVSNSSCSSFIVTKSLISAVQLDQIHRVEQVAKSLGMEDLECIVDWNIQEDDEAIRGFAIMDNFGFSEFFCRIGLRMDAVEWDDLSGYGDD